MDSRDVHPAQLNLCEIRLGISRNDGTGEHSAFLFHSMRSKAYCYFIRLAWEGEAGTSLAGLVFGCCLKSIVCGMIAHTVSTCYSFSSAEIRVQKRGERKPTGRAILASDLLFRRLFGFSYIRMAFRQLRFVVLEPANKVSRIRSLVLLHLWSILLVDFLFL